MSYVNHADLGGVDGFGPIVMDDDDEPFHGEWEARIHALTLAMGATGCWNLDMTRSARETLPNYGHLSYYEKWLAGLEKLLLANGLVTRDELATARAREAPLPLARVLHADQVSALLAQGAPTARVASTAAKFRCGDKVRTRSDQMPHHTRLPGYLRGKVGTIERVHGSHVFADARSQGIGENPEWLYSVVFDAASVWGGEANAGDRVSFDAWQPYLESA
jgi:nitrile hydratase subunit beta